MHSRTLPLSLKQSIRKLGASRKGKLPISMSSVLLAAKATAPNLKMADAELHDLVARELIASGCIIDFDVANEAQSTVASRRARLPIDHGTPRSAR